jgi:hypothetical protein
MTHSEHNRDDRNVSSASRHPVTTLPGASADEEIPPPLDLRVIRTRLGEIGYDLPDLPPTAHAYLPGTVIGRSSSRLGPDPQG